MNNTRWDNYYGGVKGNFGWLDYNGQLGYSKASDLALYQTLFTARGHHPFSGTIYDTVKIMNVQGTVKFKPIKNLTITGTMSQNVYDAATTGTAADEPSVWGLPEIEGNFRAIYTMLENKASLKANATRLTGIEFLNEDRNRREKSKTLLDLSLGGSYYFTKNVGAFLDINNLLNNKRERWYRYPTIGMNFMGGIVARFHYLLAVFTTGCDKCACSHHPLRTLIHQSPRILGFNFLVDLGPVGK